MAQGNPKAKPKTPVDTVRLKRDRDADKRASFRMADMAQTGDSQRSRADYARAASALGASATARTDSLHEARMNAQHRERRLASVRKP